MEHIPFTRRTVLLALLALLAPFVASAMARTQHNPFAALERRSGGRLRVSVHDSGGGCVLAHRAVQYLQADRRRPRASSILFSASEGV